MRLTQLQIKGLSAELLAELVKRRMVRLKVSEEEALPAVEQAIINDLQAEDRLNEEVKDILKTYEREIEQGRADYKTMFDLIKKKLVRERGIIL
jgi:hypothetical protein